MEAYLAGETDQYVWIRADSTSGRRSRAAAITAAKREWENAHPAARLALLSKSYDEQHGFLSRSEFRYEIQAAR